MILIVRYKTPILPYAALCSAQLHTFIPCFVLRNGIIKNQFNTSSDESNSFSFLTTNNRVVLFTKQWYCTY